MVTLSAETQSLCRRILRDLNQVFIHEPNITELEIVKVDVNNENKSPVLHHDHQLGLESWCIPYLYAFFYDELIEQNRRPRSDEYLLEITRLLLIICPDLSLAWSIRKSLVLCGAITVQQEQAFSKVILSRKPKSPDNFFHRQWLITRLPQLNERELHNELQICLIAAGRHAHNYYAWSYREWLLQKVVSLDPVILLEQDLQNIRDWCETHISDYSAFAFRERIMLKLFDKFNTTNYERIALRLADELKFVDDFLRIYPAQESLYLHRRFLLKQSLFYQSKQRKEFLQKEQTFIKEQMKLAPCNAWMKMRVQRHVLWAKKVLHVQFTI